MLPRYRRNNYKHMLTKKDTIVVSFSLLLTINFLLILPISSSATSGLSLRKMAMPIPSPSKSASARPTSSLLLSMSQSASLLPTHIKFQSIIPFSSEKDRTDRQQSIKGLVAANNKLPAITIITDSGLLQTMPAETATSNSSSSLKIQSRFY
jgi:hypothetical protein